MNRIAPRPRMNAHMHTIKWFSDLMIDIKTLAMYGHKLIISQSRLDEWKQHKEALSPCWDVDRIVRSGDVHLLHGEAIDTIEEMISDLRLIHGGQEPERGMFDDERFSKLNGLYNNLSQCKTDLIKYR